MNYLVTGGAGFIGSNYVRMLLTDQLGEVNSVKVLDKLTYAGSLENLTLSLEDPRFNFVQGDICDQAIVDSCVNEGDVIVHFAAESHVDRSITGPSEFIRTNVLGTQVLLEAALKKQIYKFIHVSTDEVYGSVESGFSKENDKLLPSSPYSASKAASDHLALSYWITHGLNVQVTRCCNNYGPNQFPEKVVPFFIRNLLQGKPVPIYGNGRNIREWIYVNDHCRAIQKVLDHGLAGEIYNIGSNFYLSNIQLADELIKVVGVDKSLKTYVSDRKGHDLRYALDSSKIRELGFNNEVNFYLGIEETVEWYRRNSSRWEA
jgi:dTDP-glucose 4,6-dehydratase